jgi:glycosyltransferase involved in cell wall biosynthesis
MSCSTIYGGIEKIVIDTINELSKTNSCTLLVPYGCTYKDKLLDSVNIIEYKSYDKRYNPFLYMEVYKIVKNFDIVHTHGAKATQIVYRLSKIFNLNHIATKHNTRKGKIFNSVKNVLSVSSEVSKTITHESEVIYFGIPSKEVNIKNNDTFTIVTVGRLDPIKGYDNLIKQVAMLDFNFKLNIIGDGPQKDTLEQLIHKYKLENKVCLLGFKDNIHEYLANCNLQVITSITEGFPLTLIEGILYSPIIISTPVGGIVEVLDKNYLVNIDNFNTKITDIYNNYQMSLDDFSSLHNEYKQKFNFEDYIINILDYYKRKAR